MTKEQEEAIKYLEESILVYKNTLPKISTTLETVLSMLKEKDKEIAKKDRIIDEMAEFMNKRSWKEHQLKDDDCYCCKIEYGDEKCVSYIKQYFERKAEK